MPRRYRLRLGDGTVLMVDQQGLNTWKVDSKAMVQAAGGRWRPLKDLLAMQQAAAKYAEQESVARAPVLPLVPPPPRGEKPRGEKPPPSRGEKPRGEKLPPPTARPSPDPVAAPVLAEPPPISVLAEPASVNLDGALSEPVPEPASEPAIDEGPPISPADFRGDEELAPLLDVLSSGEPPAFTAAEPEPPVPQAWADEPAIFSANAEPPPSTPTVDAVAVTDDEVASFPAAPTSKADTWDPEPSQWPDAVEDRAIRARAPVQSVADDPAPRYEYASEVPTHDAESPTYSSTPSREDRPVSSTSGPGFEEDETDDLLEPRPFVLNERFVWIANAAGVLLSRSLDLVLRVSEDVRRAVRTKWEARAARRAAAAASAPITVKSPDPDEAWPAIVVESPSNLRAAAPPSTPIEARRPDPDEGWPAIVEAPALRAEEPQELVEVRSWLREDDTGPRPSVTEDVPLIPLEPREGGARARFEVPKLDVRKYFQPLGRKVSGWGQSLSLWTLLLRKRIDDFRRPRTTTPVATPPWSEPDRPLASYEAPRKPIPPPPPTSAIPVLRLQKIEEEEEPQDMYEGPTESPFPIVWLWTKRVVLTAALAAGGFVALQSWESWYPNASRLSSTAFTEVARYAENWEQKQRERRVLEESTAQLPHLAPDTIRLVLAQSANGVSDPPDVFQAASNAADRGLSALTPAERQELKALRQELLSTLTPAERARVREYDEVRARRMPFAFEDKSALDLVARGARTLPEESRERLQALVGKAVASGLASPIASPTPKAKKKTR